jgi:hypothetical protein
MAYVHPHQLNVYEMYVANGKQPGFWLRRANWGNICARVVRVGEFTEGPPYYGNPGVWADVFDLSTGRLKEANVKIPVPGMYKTWRQIDPPEWAS